MVNGYFYAFADQAECGQAVPSIWDQTEDGEPVLISDCVQRRAVWLVEPVMSEPDENGEQTITTPGTLSEPFVILSPVELPDAADYAITPVGQAGFA